jgi:hypothetical protein
MSLLLSPEELLEVTGYRQPAAPQRAQGFWLARRSPLTGHVILDRAHYEAVCQGADKAADTAPRRRPMLRAA